MLFHAISQVLRIIISCAGPPPRCPMSFYIYGFKSFTPFSLSLLHISQTSRVLSPRFTLSTSFISYDFLSCNPLYLLFTALSNQFLLFLMIQIKNNYKFNILALVRKENRSKCSYLCNSFVMDQIIKMKCADTTHCQEKKKLQVNHKYTQRPRSL